MVFSSMVFLCVFLPAVFLLTRLTKSVKIQNAILIVMSVLFYAYGEPKYVLLMLISVLCNWWFGLQMKDEPKKGIMVMAVMLNIGLLFVFKYLDLTIAGINATHIVTLKRPHLPLPIGISFFTFQALSYVIDVYRRHVPAQTSVWRILLYISLFPQLIAGPIVKYHDIEKEIEDRTIESRTTALGFRRFSVGLGKKVLISNTMALVVDTLFTAAPSAINMAGAWLAAICYIFQIYFDFSGYSDMAIGLGEMFGFHFHENFNYPYISTSIQEFWRRWHISLSTWFKEYLYIPLGGNRKGKARTYLNKMIVFLATGLWHGANLTFVLWGLWHGFFILLEDWLNLKKMPKWLGWVYTMLIVTIGFVMFRADTVNEGVRMIGTMFGAASFTPQSIALFAAQLSPMVLTMLVAAVIGSAPVFSRLDWNGKLCNVSLAGSYVLLVICALALSTGTYNPFIYFRF